MVKMVKGSIKGDAKFTKDTFLIQSDGKKGNSGWLPILFSKIMAVIRDLHL